MEVTLKVSARHGASYSLKAEALLAKIDIDIMKKYSRIFKVDRAKPGHHLLRNGSSV